MGNILDCRPIADKILEELGASILEHQPKTGRSPKLVIISFGNDAASASYVQAKTKAGADIGLQVDHRTLCIEMTRDGVLRPMVLDELAKLNADPNVDGIIIQLTKELQAPCAEFIAAIDPTKDVDGLTPTNVDALAAGKSALYVPCTPLGCLEILRTQSVRLERQIVTILGRSPLVGKPLAQLLRPLAQRVNVCHSKTKDHERLEACLGADILISAIGRAGYVTSDMVREGAMVIDVGINRIEAPGTKLGYRIVGDVDTASVAEKALWVTRVPGGVGPMTVAMLMRNTVNAWLVHNHKEAVA